MSTRFLKVGLLLFACLGLFVGLLTTLSILDPSKFCGKSCRIVDAMNNVLGRDATRYFLATLWIAGGVWFGFLGIRLKK